jgi:hypothetical protein
MRQEINNIVEHMRDQPTSGVHTGVLNSTINNSLNVTSHEIRNELDFQLGCTMSTNTYCSILAFNSSQQNYNDDNSNLEIHETLDNKK